MGGVSGGGSTFIGVCRDGARVGVPLEVWRSSVDARGGTGLVSGSGSGLVGWGVGWGAGVVGRALGWSVEEGAYAADLLKGFYCLL